MIKKKEVEVVLWVVMHFEFVQNRAPTSITQNKTQNNQK